MKRSFSGRERVSLFLAANGKCSQCGADLVRGWHADHMTPFVRGGATEVVNGQALCPSCNLKKGDKLSRVEAWPVGRLMRYWQEEAHNRFIGSGLNDFMAMATPGAGKTLFCLRCAHSLLYDGSVERVVIVCPREHLKYQWTQKAFEVGIYLMADFRNKDGREPSDYHGVVATYQQVAADPRIHQINCRRPTLVIFDEVHHAGEEKSWGASIYEAFQSARFRLAVTGTPFRSDGTPLPFVCYVDGTCKTDYSYDYKQALTDGICRALVFPSFDGQMEWLSRDGKVAHTFEDELDERLASERLRTALHPSLDWMTQVIHEADVKLTEVRHQGHADAGGLILAMDQDHARRIADRLKKITGHDATVAISDDPDALRKIEQFGKSKDRWIIAVQMVSEGVDIPRLRVGIYATNVRTELFFRQAVGRFVRRTGDDDLYSWVYVPADPRLKEFARTVQEETEHQLAQALERERKGRESANAVDSSRAFTPISADPRRDAEIYENAGYEPWEMERVRSIVEKTGTRANEHELAKFLRGYEKEWTRNGTAARERPASASPVTKRKDQRMTELRDLVGRLVGKLASRTSASFEDINATLKKLSLGASRRQATEEQLQQQVDWLLAQIEAAGDAS